jgi:hypothetical protein
VRPVPVKAIMGVMPRVVALLAVLVSGLLVSGCSGGQGEVLHSGGSIVLVDADHDGEAVAAIGYEGDVAMAGACLGIGAATVLWPHGTTIVSDDPLTIEVPGLGRVKLGDHVTGGAVRYAGNLPKGSDSVPSECPTDQAVGFLTEG